MLRRTSSARASSRGFTLIELLVVIAIIAVLIALLLPAVQAAREAARRSQCVNNLKQLGLACANYVGATNVYPMAAFWGNGNGRGGSTSFGALIHLLPYFEQTQAYNAFNCSLSFGDLENSTVHGIGIATLWCPSDGTISTPAQTAAPLFTSKTPIAVQFSSYGVNTGTWFFSPPFPWKDKWNGTPNPDYAPAVGSYNGVIFHESAVPIAGITDGTSNTIALGERAHGLLSLAVQPTWDWFVSGARTQMVTTYPINAIKKEANFAAGGTGSNTVGGSNTSYEVCASSFHPGGANFTFCDGSVRFLKDSIDTWQNDLVTGLPLGAVKNSLGEYNALTPGSKVGVYQALSTRASGEVISSDSF